MITVKDVDMFRELMSHWLIRYPTLNKYTGVCDVSKLPLGIGTFLICHILFSFITPSIAFRAFREFIDLAWF